MKSIVIIVICIIAVGCSQTRRSEFNKITLGMSYKNVLQIMGNPDDAQCIMDSNDVYIYKLSKSEVAKINFYRPQSQVIQMQIQNIDTLEIVFESTKEHSTNLQNPSAINRYEKSAQQVDAPEAASPPR